MDYKAEQHDEIEALDSIYCGELEKHDDVFRSADRMLIVKLRRSWSAHLKRRKYAITPASAQLHEKLSETEPYYKFVLPIKSEEYEPESNNGLSCKLEFTYTPKYPEEPLVVQIDEPENFEDGDETKLKEHLAEQMEENLGMVMVFTLVSAAQEWLNVQWDRIKLHREESAAKKLIEEEEAERKRFEGTRVTVETFMTWKEKFDEEMGHTKRRELAALQGKKLTGRELFMTDKTLDQSDLKFLEDGEVVKVDESLFQNLADLDLDDEDDEDDLDYDPLALSDDSV